MQIEPAMFHSASKLMETSSVAMEHAANRISLGGIETGVVEMKGAQAAMEVAIGVSKVADQSLETLVSLITR